MAAKVMTLNVVLKILVYPNFSKSICSAHIADNIHKRLILSLMKERTRKSSEGRILNE